MYITPDIFETEAITSTEMPHATMGPLRVTHDIQPSVLGKRRRAGCDIAIDLSPYAFPVMTARTHLCCIY
jgi:hypothetical protein